MLAASLSSAVSKMESFSRWAAMKVRRSSPSMVGGISIPEFERSRAWVAAELGPVAALTAEARRA